MIDVNFFLVCLMNELNFIDIYFFAQEIGAVELPVSGQDLIDLGVPAGPKIGKILKALQHKWITSAFKKNKHMLLADAKIFLSEIKE